MPGSEFVTDEEFRWVLGWVIGGVATVSSLIAVVVGYVLRRLTMLPCRREIEKTIDELKEEKERAHQAMMRELQGLQVHQHGENTRRLDRIESKMDRMAESVPSIIVSSQTELYRRLAKLEGK